ncbi:hypothetical protein MICAC_5300002 [Microcystis aeruginosa PCC 9443]|uniref:Uncharacterized protein n=1 Tax=Microcystis aeruginosa PCC 9443 TaxID=1160281 RepID=I4G7Y5_MICAE|nr:hypothetical protein MICAC_5300002 [Microcystis aeruginosa PCC 9443]
MLKVGSHFTKPVSLRLSQPDLGQIADLSFTSNLTKIMSSIMLISTGL